MHTSTAPRKQADAARRSSHRKGWMRRLSEDVLFVARRDRKLLLLPLILVLLLLAVLMVVGTSLGPLAPFIYPLF